MESCTKCDGQLARINGRTLKEALDFTGVSSPAKFSNVEWVDVCPSCDADALGAETNYSWPFQSSDGVMRVIDDFIQGELSPESRCLELCGFKFSEAAISSANTLLGLEGENENTQSLELSGAKLSISSTYQDFLEFSHGVCEWGRGKRVWGNLLRHHGEDALAQELRSWLVYAINSQDDESAISRGIRIKGLGVSFASKHLRMLNPKRYAVLDDVLMQGLGIALNPRGYRLFLSALRSLADQLGQSPRIANIEAAIFLLVRQQVRAKS